VHLQTRSITTPGTSQKSHNHGEVRWRSSLYIQMEFVRMSRCGSRNIGWEGKWIWRGTRLYTTTQIAWINDCSARVCEEPHKFHGSMKARQQSVGLCPVKENLYISYNGMMSLYSPVSPYVPPCVSLNSSPLSLYRCMPPARLPLPN